MAGRLPQAWLDELRDRADIVQVVSRYVQLNPKGGRYWGLCPFHGEKTPSFSVNPQRQMYYCFGCGAGGNVYNFIMEYENYSFGEALSHLAGRAGVELPKIEYSREAKEKAEREAREAYVRANQELLASIIYCEAGNQPYEGQVAVGAVIMNRVKSGSYPNSIEEVIYQSGQFGPAATGWLNRVRSSKGYSQTALQAAGDALNGSNPIGNCLYFDQGGAGMKIGAHYFH